MRIAIIADPLDLERKTGISVYVENLVIQLLLDKDNEYFFFHSAKNTLLTDGNEVVVPLRFKVGVLRSLEMLWRKFVTMPILLRKYDIDIVHELNSIGPHCFDFFGTYRSVITVFDLTPLSHPKLHGFLNSLGFRLFLGVSIKRADRVIAISEATKQDIITHFGTPEEKISVIYLGSKLVKDVTQPYSMDFNFPYILSVGTLEPRKNLKNLIKAFVAFKMSGDFREIKLVLTGKEGWKMPNLFKDIEGIESVRADIILTGFVTDSELASLYSDCLFFVYLSIYEGFGLPVLEAMSFSVPVITSNVSSLPEVAGDACVLVDPLDIGKIVEAFKLLSLDQNLRKRLSEDGFHQSLKFGWDKCSSETVKLYSHSFDNDR